MFGLRITKKQGINLITAIDNLLSSPHLDLTEQEIEEYLALQNEIRIHFGFPPFSKKK